MKISDCGMVLEEQPSKLTEALRLFLQGLGYAVKLGRPKFTTSASLEGKPAAAQYVKNKVQMLSQTLRVSVSGDSVRSSPWPIRITENPIDHAVHC
ncbi:hypothetical protein WDU94_001479 [Cyamophila willieti]